MARTKSQPATELFPIEVTFTRDPTIMRFTDARELDKWKQSEQEFWNRYAQTNDPFAVAFRENLSALRDLNTHDEEAFRNSLTRFQNTYLPSSSSFVRAVERFSTVSPDASRIALSLFLRPGQRATTNSLEYQQAQTLVVAYQALGDPLQSRERIEAAVADAERLQRAESERAATFDDLMQTVESEFKTRFDGLRPN